MSFIFLHFKFSPFFTFSIINKMKRNIWIDSFSKMFFRHRLVYLIFCYYTYYLNTFLKCMLIVTVQNIRILPITTLKIPYSATGHSYWFIVRGNIINKCNFFIFRMAKLTNSEISSIWKCLTLFKEWYILNALKDCNSHSVVLYCSFSKLKFPIQPGMVAHWVSTLWWKRQMIHCESEASLANIVNGKPSRSS